MCLSSTMKMYAVLFVFLFILPVAMSNSTDFRVAHGLPVVDMKQENYEHLVRIFIVHQTMTRNVKTNEVNNVFKTDRIPELGPVSSCTGMKLTEAQLRVKKLPKTGLADYVLTAGHCVNFVKNVKDKNGKVVKKGDVITIRSPLHVYVVNNSELAATPSLKWEKSKKQYKLVFKHLKPGAQVTNVKWITYKYPNNQGYKYNGTTNELSDMYDIALLKLDTQLKTPLIPLQLNDDLKPGGVTERDKCRFAGWGSDEIGRNDGRLKKVVTEKGMQVDGIERYTERECEREGTIRATEAFGENGCPNEKHKLTHINWAQEAVKTKTCTRHQRGSMPCHGDSGGPLMCQSKNIDGTYDEEKVVGVANEIAKVLMYKMKPRCLRNPKVKKFLGGCHQQKGSKMNFLVDFHRIAESKTLIYLRKCERILRTPETYRGKKSGDECNLSFKLPELELDLQHANQ